MLRHTSASVSGARAASNRGPQPRSLAAARRAIVTSAQSMLSSGELSLARHTIEHRADGVLAGFPLCEAAS